MKKSLIRLGARSLLGILTLGSLSKETEQYLGALRTKCGLLSRMHPSHPDFMNQLDILSSLINCYKLESHMDLPDVKKGVDLG